MTSLADITGVDRQQLKSKFSLEPLHRFDRNNYENLLFVSPNVLLSDSELKDGGYLERSPKKVLGLVTKDILESEDDTLFQVPELTCLHMGYGKNSNNKEGRLAISKEDAKMWFGELNFSFSKLSAGIANKGVQERAEAMEVDPQSINDDTVYPQHSGLLIPQKGSRILLMSILTIYARKRSEKKNPKRKEKNSGKIGANKISDFILFWSLPHLLNYTQRKVEEIKMHHLARGKEPHSLIKTVKKSAWQIISEATKTKSEVQSKLMAKLKHYYTEAILRREFTLLKCDDGSPVVLVPLPYVIEAEKNYPLHLEDIGRKWRRDDGNSMSNEEFLSAFVKSSEIQEDYFNCMKMAKVRNGVDYSIIFPDKSSFACFLGKVRESDPNALYTYVDSQGKGMRSPSLAVVKYDAGNITVSFTYFQATTDRGSVAALFRAAGTHYCNNFSIVFLRGSTINKNSDCMLGHLYHVQAAEQMSFKQGKLQEEKNKKILDFRSGISKFVDLDFPESFSFFKQSISRDYVVKKAKEKFPIKPETFDPGQHIKVVFATNAKQRSLKNACLNKKKKIRTSNKRMLLNQAIKAVNLDGCLLSTINQYGCKNNIGVTLAINNTLGPKQPPAVLTSAVDRVICYFVMAIIKAGLRLVFPAELHVDEDRERIENRNDIPSGCEAPMQTGEGDVNAAADSDVDDKNYEDKDGEDYRDDDDDDFENNDEDEDDEDYSVEEDVNDDSEDDEDDENYSVEEDVDDDSEDDEDMEDEKDLSQVPSTSGENAAFIHPPIREGIPEDDILEELANDIDPKCWKKLGRRLKVEKPKLTAIHKENEEYCEKAYEMLLHWKQMNASAATYKILFDALSHKLVMRMDLAVKYCCEKKK